MYRLLFIIKKLYNIIIDFFYVLLNYKRFESFQDIENILLFKVGSMGDNLITMPTIASIKNMYPSINITILTNSGKLDAVSIENLIDKSYVKEFINYTGKSKLELLKLLKDKRYDLVIDLTQPSSLIRTLRNMIVFRFLGIKSGIGWNVSELSFLRKSQDKYNLVDSELEKYLFYLKRYNVKIDKSFILDIQTKDVSYIDEILKKKDLKGKKLIAFVVGSKRDTNRWPIEYFNEVIKWVNEKSDFTPIIIGGKEDNILVKKLTEQVYNFCGLLTPIQSAELFKRCELTISNDTGPMHLSYAVGTKVIAIFSARDFRKKWYPPRELGVVLRDEVIECRLCYKESCENVKCLKSIKPDKIVKIIIERIESEI